MTNVNLIVAASENNVIGFENDLPWNLPDDMSFFKEKTLESTVIMGRKNYLSIPKKFRPLKNRINIILTTNKSFKAKGCIIAESLEKALEIAQKDNRKIFIIGGGKVYEYALENNLVDIIYLTRVHATIQGDIFFPKIDMKSWNTINKKFHQKDQNHKYAFTFLKLQKTTN